LVALIALVADSLPCLVARRYRLASAALDALLVLGWVAAVADMANGPPLLVSGHHQFELPAAGTLSTRGMVAVVAVRTDCSTGWIALSYRLILAALNTSLVRPWVVITEPFDAVRTEYLLVLPVLVNGLFLFTKIANSFHRFTSFLNLV
jgi:hypothetical protein